MEKNKDINLKSWQQNLLQITILLLVFFTPISIIFNYFLLAQRNSAYELGREVGREDAYRDAYLKGHFEYHGIPLKVRLKISEKIDNIEIRILKNKIERLEEELAFYHNLKW